MDQPLHVIVMKVGLHNGERWSHIVERKLNEEMVAGVAYWGYGGSVCNPFTQVQPFAKRWSPITVLMVRTESDFAGNPMYASHRSTDGKTWETVPHGVETSGRHALVLRSLQRVNFDLDLGAYEVAVGKKEGTPLTEYLRYRTDKACARLRSAPSTSDPHVVNVLMRADLVAPYAVFLRAP